MTEAPKCLQCGSDGVVPIAYGFPGREMWEAEERGELALGGCVITGDDPRWQCRRCWTRWNDDTVWPGPPPAELERLRGEGLGVGWWEPEPVARRDYQNE